MDWPEVYLLPLCLVALMPLLKVLNYKVANNPQGSHFRTPSKGATVGTFVLNNTIISAICEK